jgi:hypothetical protein
MRPPDRNEEKPEGSGGCPIGFVPDPAINHSPICSTEHDTALRRPRQQMDTFPTCNLGGRWRGVAARPTPEGIERETEAKTEGVMGERNLKCFEQSHLS